MRILHILDHSLPLQSGYVFRSLGILRAQRALGWETYQLTAPKQTTASFPVEQVDGWTFYRTLATDGRLSSMPVTRELLEIRATTRRIAEVVREMRPDILHAHSPVLNGIPALRVGRRMGIPVVYEVRAFWEDAAVDHGSTRAGSMRYRVTRRLETSVLRRADAVTTICQGLKDDIVGRGIPEEKVAVIPNAVEIESSDAGQSRDADLARSLGLDGHMVLGFIGSFYAYEGIALLLAALPAIIAGQPGVKLLLAGGGPEELRLRALIRDLGLGEKVVMTGRVPHERIGRYYELVDVFVYPRLPMRLTELVTPLKPLEAMAHGKIVVASDVGGHKELVKHGLTGFLVKAGDVDGLAKGVCELINQRERWPAIGAQASRYIEEERTWQAIVQRYRLVYQTVRRRR